MNVTVDARPLVGNRTGIGVHTAEIARRLDVDPPPLLAAHAEIEDKSGIENCRFRVDPMPLGVAWQQFVLPRIAREGVLWGPHGTLPVALRVPAVVTLHDFTSLTSPRRHRLKTVASFNLFIGRSLEKAARVAAVSRAVADEAMRWFGVPAAKIAIVPNGVDEFFLGRAGVSPAGPDASRLRGGGTPPDQPAGTPARPYEGDYILFVGTLEPRKGIDDLLAAYESLPRPRPRVVLCGDLGWKTTIPPDVEVTGYVSRERLRDLYRHARLFVYPSRAEGFGIPPLEAMACGAPVIATRVGAIPEFAGDAAILIDPGDRDALRAAIERLLRDAGLRRELRARGPERARRYRWDESARTMTALLEEAAR